VKAVFLDRDGVLIRDVHLLTRSDQLQLTNGAPQAVHEMHRAGYTVVVVTNQAVVARGLASEQEVRGIHECIQDMLRAASVDPIDRFYFCPHHPNADLEVYRTNCTCRKPEPGLLLQASVDLGIDLASSWMVGDRISDIMAGHLAGCRTILVETGMHWAPPIESASASRQLTVSPDYRCVDLQAAACTILGEQR
jgi:D-glycero-D-manno-heptose 1,7-bisphosphate phosphatase